MIIRTLCWSGLKVSEYWLRMCVARVLWVHTAWLASCRLAENLGRIRIKCVSLVTIFLLWGHVSLAAEESMTLITVDKSSQQAHLFLMSPKHGPFRKLHTFTIASGEARGDKFRKGDLRTPEGIYFPDQIISDRRLAPKKHGPLAISLNYPNPFDRLEKKTGYGIWLHGAGNDSRIKKRYVTQGCVAFYNDEILKLQHWIRPLRSAVIISNGLEQVNRDEDIASIWRQTQAWAQAWDQRQHEEYGRFYSPDFKSGWRGRNAYLTYKSQVFRNYRKMSVEMNQIHVLAHAKYGVSIMNQDFAGDRFRSSGRKVLYWKKHQEQWLIVREDFGRSPFAKLALTESMYKLLR